MPMVHVRVIEGVFTPEQKQQMISQLTETMVEIEGENLRPVTCTPSRGAPRPPSPAEAHQR